MTRASTITSTTNGISETPHEGLLPLEKIFIINQLTNTTTKNPAKLTKYMVNTLFLHCIRRKKIQKNVLRKVKPLEQEKNPASVRKATVRLP